MNISELSVYPEIEEIVEGSKIDSAQYNRNFSSIEESILRAILNGRDIKKYTEKLQKANVAAYAALSSVINNNTDSAFTMSAYDGTIHSNTSYVNVDTIYGNITTGILKSFSKIARVNGIVNPNLKVVLRGYRGYDPTSYNDIHAGDTTDYTFSNKSDIYDAFDGKPETFWIQDHNSNNTHYIMKIDLPPTLTNRFNMIQIDPYPLYGIIIEDIMFVNQYGLTISLKNENFIGYNPITSHNGSPLKIYTQPVETNGTIYIKFRPIGSLSIIGFSNIDFKFVDFITNSLSSSINNSGTVISPTQLPIFEVPGSRNTTLVNKTIKFNKVNLVMYYHANKDNPLNTLIDFNVVGLCYCTARTLEGATSFDSIPIANTYSDWQQEITINPNCAMYIQLDLKSLNLTAGVIKSIQFELAG